MADVVVVGAGIIGLAAADALVRRGADVVVLERGEPGDGQSAGAARGFRHLHATGAQIADAVAARALWDAWSARAGEPLVGEEGALRLGGDVAADAARLRACGVAAEVVEHAGDRHPALRPDAGPLLWDPRGGAIRAARTIAWLRDGLDVRRAEVTAVAPGRVETADGADRLRRGRGLRGRGDGAALAARHDAAHGAPAGDLRRAGRRRWRAAGRGRRDARLPAARHHVARVVGRRHVGRPQRRVRRADLRRGRRAGAVRTRARRARRATRAGRPARHGGRRAAGPPARSARGCTPTRGRRSPGWASRSARSSACSPSSPATTRTPSCCIASPAWRCWRATTSSSSRRCSGSDSRAPASNRLSLP